jgi:SAM-dependent methyltransferase
LYEILRNLRRGAKVLDLGSSTGSFTASDFPEIVAIRLDNKPVPTDDPRGIVQGDAARLPFPDRSFDAVIANHSLEHVSELDRTIEEIARVVRSDGALYVAVPDASTFTDRVYRWLHHGGEHVNAFVSAPELSGLIARETGLRLVATRTLHSSLTFLCRRHYGPRPPRKLWLFGNGNLRFLVFVNYALRVCDRLFSTRLSVYGWAFYFGRIAEPVDTVPWSNVCANCGTGHSAASLQANGWVREWTWPRSYACPACRGWNVFTKDG